MLSVNLAEIRVRLGRLEPPGDGVGAVPEQAFRRRAIFPVWPVLPGFSICYTFRNLWGNYTLGKTFVKKMGGKACTPRIRSDKNGLHGFFGGG